MSGGFYSALHPAPHGFQTVKLGKRELLSGPVTIYCEHLADVLVLVENFQDRVSGVLVTPGLELRQVKLGPQLWHISLPERCLPDLATFCAPILEALGESSALRDQNQEGVRALARGQRELEVTRIDYNRVTASLQRQVRELSEGQRQLQAIVDHSPSLMYVVDGEFCFRLVNRQFEKVFGVSREQAIGRTPHEVLPPVLAEQLMRLDLQALVAPELLQVEEQLPSPDGPHTHLSVRFRLPATEEGQGGLCTISADLTEHIRMEAQLRQSQKLEAIGRLAGGIAHDFNNLLTAILNYANLLEEDPGMPQSGLRDVGQIAKAARRAASLTSQLLAFSRQQPVTLRTLDLSAIVRDMEPMLQRLIGEHVKVILSMDPAPCAVHMDQGQVEQILLNLALNARDAMPNGGELGILTAIRLPGGSGHPHVVLSVTDTGVGMDAATLEHIFEPFFTTKALGKGTGLGLATVHAIVDQAHGHMRVDSQPGSGSRFEIWIPAREEQVRENAPAKPGALTPMQGTVLLVEDEEAVREALHRTLERLGLTVLSASGPGSALGMVTAWEGPLDLVLSDVVMPEMDGVELAHRLLALRPGLRILLMTGYAERTVLEASRDPRILGILPKPFTPSDLERALREALSSGEVRDGISVDQG